MSHSSTDSLVDLRQRIGIVLLWLGGLMAILVFADLIQVRLPGLPSFWYRSRAFHVPVCLLLGGFGALCLRQGPETLDRLGGRSELPQPVKGPVFESLRMYTRANCPLCDEALEILQDYRGWLPEVELVDIEQDKDLQQQHGESIPVVELDGRVRFRGRVSVWGLERMLSARMRRQSRQATEVTE